MTNTLTIPLERPIRSAVLSDGTDSQKRSAGQNLSQEQQHRCIDDSLVQACAALKKTAAALQQLQQSLIEQHREDVVKLAVEIARRILAFSVEKGQYSIERIVAEALKNCTTTANVTVRLHPDDLKACRHALEKQMADVEGIRFVGDKRLGRAECVVETDRGTIEASINRQLERVEEALSKV